MTSKPDLQSEFSDHQSHYAEKPCPEKTEKKNKTSKQTTTNAIRPSGLAAVMCFRISSSWGRIMAQ